MESPQIMIVGLNPINSRENSGTEIFNRRALNQSAPKTQSPTRNPRNRNPLSLPSPSQSQARVTMTQKAGNES